MQVKGPSNIEPSALELSAIDGEWPLIDAEIALLDAEILMLFSVDHGGPSPLAWHRLRRAEDRVTRVAAELSLRSDVRPFDWQVAA